MNKRFVLGAAICAALVAGAVGPVRAESPMDHQPKAQGVVIEGPWARATPGRSGNGAAYFRVTNHGKAADRLVAAASPAARRAELHTHIKEGGVMRMRKVAGVDLAPGASAAFEPGGHHVMLMGLKAPLKLGARFPLTLRFEKAGDIDVTVTVMGIGAMGPHGAHPGAHR